MLQIYLPFPKDTISQKFGDNATALYAAQGLKGHPAYDWVVPYGTPILNCVANAYCYSVMHVNDPVLMDYRAVFFLVTDDLGDTYEISYGHCSAIFAEVGKTYQVGDLIANVGNTGPVFVGQHEVTEAEKQSGSTAGAHLHGPQVRGPLKKVKYTNLYPNILYDQKGPLQIDGFFFAIPNYKNGYNGCINFAPFSTEVVAGDHTEVAIQTVTQDLPVVQTAITKLPTLPESQQTPIKALLTKILASFSALLTKK